MNIWHYLPQYLSGAWLTISLSVLSFAGAILLGVVGALGRRSRWQIFRGLSAIYVEIVRNIPGLVLIYFVYFGLPSIGILIPSYVAGVIALSLTAGAYLTVIFATGLGAVPIGQAEAAQSLGLGRASTFFRVVFPQALRIIYPPVVNEFLQLILGSSLLSTIAILELTGVTQIVNSVTFQTIAAFTIALVIYLGLTNLVAFGASGLSLLLFRAPLTSETSKGRGRRPFGIAKIKDAELS